MTSTIILGILLIVVIVVQIKQMRDAHKQRSMVLENQKDIHLVRFKRSSIYFEVFMLLVILVIMFSVIAFSTEEITKQFISYLVVLGVFCVSIVIYIVSDMDAAKLYYNDHAFYYGGKMNRFKSIKQIEVPKGPRGAILYLFTSSEGIRIPKDMGRKLQVLLNDYNEDQKRKNKERR